MTKAYSLTETIINPTLPYLTIFKIIFRIKAFALQYSSPSIGVQTHLALSKVPLSSIESLSTTSNVSANLHNSAGSTETLLTVHSRHSGRFRQFQNGFLLDLS
ncbi:hypothetical protein ABEB36_004289 [Hypothenemus hampei]|uniref:Uncharacterized protein n=1 Tax=Hypothenemus hampei TaxID=57062 RepID=A0ABD1F2V2_HYPHA